ncbi:hypothetical protein HYS79_02025 [Patescibacteria group bacterium]|nr:hypothetical protein [Patescibacteria group bacterium]
METTFDTLDDMKGQKPKITKVSQVVDRINELRKIRDDAVKELRELEEQPIQATSPIPSDFDYKSAIMRLFKERPSVALNIDNVVAGISDRHGFVPNRNTIAIRVGYLADSAKPKQLERVKDRRGFYRLPTKDTGAREESSG